MLIRHLAIALPLALAACALEPATEERAADLDCGSFCDPADLDEAQQLELTIRYGGWAFPDSTIYDQSCANLGTNDQPRWDCVVSLITTANPCGPVAVECFRSRCNVKALDYCH